jgi:hypothetical protein
VPVRIIFKGLILFRFPKAGEHDAGKLVVELINKPDIPRRLKTETPDKLRPGKPPRGPHEHNHDAYIQIATDQGDGDERTPVYLDTKDRIDIVCLDASGKQMVPVQVGRDPSFVAHVPQLSEIIRNGTDNVRQMEKKRGARNTDLVRNTITVDRGSIRVRQVVTWDEGGFPWNGDPTLRGVRPAAPGLVRFVGSSLQGHVASEFIVDILDATAIQIKSAKNNKLNKDHRARGNLNHRTPYDTVELLITNYEYQENTALPYGFDFQWLFETAGYPAVDLSGANLDEFARVADRFDHDTYDNERRMLLDPVDTTGSIDSFRLGRPFPYLASVDQLNPLNKNITSTDEEYRPICIGGHE